MKKFILLFVVLLVSGVVMAETKIGSPIKGSMVFSTNSTTTFVGFVGPKVCKDFKMKSITAEVAIVAMPGLLVRPETKPGLALGSIITIKKDSWKLKPIIGATFIKTKDWQPMLCVGFIF